MITPAQRESMVAGPPHGLTARRGAAGAACGGHPGNGERDRVYRGRGRRAGRVPGGETNPAL